MFGWRRASRVRVATGTAAGPAVPAANEPGAGDRAQALLRRLEWTVLRRLDGLLQGDYRTLLRGFGLDFADLREYQPGDDVRHMDWNVTARLQTPHVREFQEDREISAWFLLDLSGSVDFGSGGVRKRALLDEFTVVMARLLAGHGNRVGAVLYGGAADAAPPVVPARTGRRHLLHIIDRMNALPVSGAGADGRDGSKPGAGGQGPTRLGELLERARAVISRRSMLFVVSDFISEPGWERPLAMLARRHEVVVVRLTDPLEEALPDIGLVVLQDAETGEQMFVDTHDAAFRARFAEAAARREEALQEAFARAGVPCLSLNTDTRLDLALLQFARRRAGIPAAGAKAA